MNKFSLSALAPEDQEELLLEITDTVTEAVFLRLIEMMDEKSRDEFSAFLDTDPGEDAVSDFIHARIPDADKVIEEVLADMRNDILATTGESQE